MGGLFEPPFWVCVCVFEEMGRGGGGTGRNAPQLQLLLDDTETHETLHNLSSIQLGSNDANIFPVTIIGLKSMDNHGLKTGLHFFSFWKVNKQNKDLQVIW